MELSVGCEWKFSSLRTAVSANPVTNQATFAEYLLCDRYWTRVEIQKKQFIFTHKDFDLKDEVENFINSIKCREFRRQTPGGPGSEVGYRAGF